MSIQNVQSLEILQQEKGKRKQRSRFASFERSKAGRFAYAFQAPG
jgi:hypothetical protein